MPKRVDHEQRRRQISKAAARIATSRGLQGISFREVAAEAGISVSLVQHYFGTKDQLLIDTLDLQSGRLGAIIVDRLNELGADAPPVDRLAVILRSFIPDDDESRNAMLLYLGYAGAALTDPALKRAEAFRNADGLRQVIANELRRAAERGDLDVSIDPDTRALGLLSMVLGLALAVLLDHTGAPEAGNIVEAALRSREDRVGRPGADIVATERP